LVAQFNDARAVRDWVRIDRLQYSAHHIVADRSALLAQAAGFIDPLYSKGFPFCFILLFAIRRWLCASVLFQQ
jgi:FADH2 O2-dependent halogenase